LTGKENKQYKRNSRNIEYNGENKTISQWCDVFNMDYFLIHKRLKYGWTVKKAFETPARKRKNKAA